MPGNHGEIEESDGMKEAKIQGAPPLLCSFYEDANTQDHC